MWQSIEHRNHTQLNFEQFQKEEESLIEDRSHVRLQEHKSKAGSQPLSLSSPDAVLLHPPLHFLSLPPLS